MGSPTCGVWPDGRVWGVTFSISLDLVKCHLEVVSPGVKRVLGDPWEGSGSCRHVGGGGGAEQRTLKRLY